MTSRAYLNLPNWITIGRIFAVPILLVVMLFMDDNDPSRLALNRSLSFISAIIFTLAMCSDMVDGYLARKKGLSSTFGKFIDPLADKMLFLVAMIMMIPLGRIPAWIVCIFLMREVTVTALRGIAIDEGVVIAASHLGKYKSAFVSTATVGLLMHYPFFGIQWRLVAWVIMVPSLIFSVVSGLHYAIGFFRGLPAKGSAS
ncbi:MAG: CDP-diacylglycerol--glycerol-3-phosphate 3-phosphatidyltransferase [Pseudomonadota bacterium]